MRPTPAPPTCSTLWERGATLTAAAAARGAAARWRAARSGYAARYRRRARCLVSSTCARRCSARTLDGVASVPAVRRAARVHRFATDAIRAPRCRPAQLPRRRRSATVVTFELPTACATSRRARRRAALPSAAARRAAARCATAHGDAVDAEGPAGEDRARLAPGWPPADPQADVACCRPVWPACGRARRSRFDIARTSVDASSTLWRAPAAARGGPACRRLRLERARGSWRWARRGAAATSS